MKPKISHSQPLLELKFSQPSPDAPPKFSGYAAKWDGLDTKGDTIKRGAFLATLQSRRAPILLRWQHFGPVIGKWTEIREDDYGLYVEGELTPGNSLAEDVAALLRHGAISGLSIGFYARKSQRNADGTRTLLEVDLIEISVVEEPADMGAQVAEIKAAIDTVHSIKSSADALEYLVLSGLSTADASAFLDRIKLVFDAEEDAMEQMRAEIKSALGMM